MTETPHRHVPWWLSTIVAVCLSLAVSIAALLLAAGEKVSKLESVVAGLDRSAADREAIHRELAATGSRLAAIETDLGSVWRHEQGQDGKMVDMQQRADLVQDRQLAAIDNVRASLASITVQLAIVGRSQQELVEFVKSTAPIAPDAMPVQDQRSAHPPLPLLDERDLRARSR